MQLARVLVSITLAGGLVAACAQRDTSAPAQPAAPSTGEGSSTATRAVPASSGRELLVAIGGESEEGYDPTLGWGRYGSPLFQSTLLKRDQNLRITNDLAERVEVSDDRLTWTVKIRQDAKFSDGSALTAKDVAYTFTKAAESGGLTDVTNLKEARAIGDYEVQFQLHRPQVTFINRLATLGIVPAHAHGPDYARNPIGSGPYKLVKWDEGQQLIVEANPFYYGLRPQIQRITFLFTDEEATFAAARAGNVHVAVVPPALAKQAIPNMRLVAVKSVDNRGILFPTQPADGRTTADGKPIGNNVTNDPAIRKAINYAIDRQALVAGVLEGFGSPAYGPANGTPWDQPEAAIADANPQEAERILAQAGWRRGADGGLEKDGLKAEFQILYPASDSTRQALALAVADMIRPLGIHATPAGKSWDDIAREMHSNAVLFGWGSHDATEIYNIYHSSMAGVGFYNPGFYQSPITDQKLDRAMGASSDEEAAVLFKAVQWDGTHGVTAKGDAVWAWLVNLEHTYFVSNCLDIGTPQVEPHGHGWPITANIVDWRWTCE